MEWYTIDLHLHTPSSSDYQQMEVSPQDILRRAEARGLDIIALTDHNTVAGYRRMQEEIEELELLEKLKRIMPDEQSKLAEYRRLLEKILVLPGFEFTATFGFHVLAIFPPEKPVREIEHLLLDLYIPADQLDEGSATIGASSDVLTAYRLIMEAGGISIAAHSNSNNGVAMRGFPIGGQTRIAYTQDSHLHALEVTDLENSSKRSTAAFFSGAKPEYPRRMHCIQGSDAHRLKSDPTRKKNLGVGDRTTDVLLPEASFDALRELFLSNDFARTRPHRLSAEPVFDFIRSAQEEGPNIIQDFHESMTVRGGKRYAIIADICALANTNGGTLFIGLSPDRKKPIMGVQDIESSISQLEKEISNRINPPLACSLDVHETQGKKVIVIQVPRGSDPPHAVDGHKIYVRSEAETDLAVRDEIVGLVLREHATTMGETTVEPSRQLISETLAAAPIEKKDQKRESAPRTGVEVMSVETRGDDRYYTMRDLRNGNVVKNVTLKSARRLWHYAIKAFDQLTIDFEKAEIEWQGKFGLVQRQKKDKSNRFDLVERERNTIHYYFGVTEDGIHGPWKGLVGQEDE